MLSLSLSSTNFNELNITTLAKRPLLDAIKVLYRGNEAEFIGFVENLGLNYHKTFPSLYHLNNEINGEIQKFNDIAERNELEKLDYRAVTLLRRSLKQISEFGYYKLAIDLKNAKDPSKITAIKDAFLLAQSPSIIEFKELDDRRLNLIYNKRGISYYCSEPLIANARDTIQLIENFKEPKDNNFIVARFLLEFAKNLKNAGVDESFYFAYEQRAGLIKEFNKSIDEVILWGGLNREEKEKMKAQEKEDSQDSPSTIAKAELKIERDSLRSSAPQNSTDEIVEKTKVLPRLYNVESMPNPTQEIPKLNKEKIISDSFELYEQKEIEKAKLRLERAKKESFEAYRDLKNNLDSGLSLLDAIKIIQQKYRNEDTVNFASLLFSQDILNLREKESEIVALRGNIEALKQNVLELEGEIVKREETITKQRGTLQVKINEMSLLKESFEEELERLKEVEVKFGELEALNNEQGKTIEELDAECDKLTAENRGLGESKIRLESELKNALSNTENLERELQDLKNKEAQSAKLAIERNSEKEFLRIALDKAAKTEAEQNLKIQSLENKIDNLYNRLIDGAKTSETKQESLPTDTPKEKPRRSRDILGNDF